MTYANGVTVIIDHKLPNGVRFEGSDGWIFVTRGAERVTASDPVPKGAAAKALQASKPEILTTPLGADDDVRLHESPKGDHHLDWITSIQTRKPAVTTAEIAHRSTSACILGWIGMKLGRKLTWDPVKESFVDDEIANSMQPGSPTCLPIPARWAARPGLRTSTKSRIPSVTAAWSRSIPWTVPLPSRRATPTSSPASSPLTPSKATFWHWTRNGSSSAADATRTGFRAKRS
jgi:hypothetical protein